VNAGDAYFEEPPPPAPVPLVPVLLFVFEPLLLVPLFCGVIVPVLLPFAFGVTVPF
jgi:hypothetical protein